GDLHQTPVAQHVFVDLGADPVHGERDQPHADRGVEALHRLHQSDVAFLDEIAHRQAVTGVSARNVHHEAQVREHQLAGRLQATLLATAGGQGGPFLAAEYGNARDALDISVETADRAGKNQIGVAAD